MREVGNLIHRHGGSAIGINRPNDSKLLTNLTINRVTVILRAAPSGLSTVWNDSDDFFQMLTYILEFYS